MVSYHGRDVAIEYDGAYWHKDNVSQDSKKSVELLAAGYIVVRLREAGLSPLDISNLYYLEITVSSQTPRPIETIRELRQELEAI